MPLNLRKRTVKYDACCGNCDGVAMREGRGNKCSFVKMKRGANILAQDHVTFNMKSSPGLFSVCVVFRKWSQDTQNPLKVCQKRLTFSKLNRNILKTCSLSNLFIQQILNFFQLWTWHFFCQSGDKSFIYREPRVASTGRKIWKLSSIHTKFLSCWLMEHFINIFSSKEAPPSPLTSPSQLSNVEITLDPSKHQRVGPRSNKWGSIFKQRKKGHRCFYFLWLTNT